MPWNTLGFRTMSAAVRNLIVPIYALKLRKFQRQIYRGTTVHRANLLAKIQRCQETRFGLKHGFAAIRSVSDFRKALPISDYSYFRPYIDAVAAGDTAALFPASEKVHMFACTTGTTGVPKLNPIASTWLREYRNDWEVWGVKAISDHASMIGTKILQLIGPPDLGRTPSGLPIGMVSSVAAKYQNPILHRFYAVPNDVCTVSDSLAKYYSLLRLSIVKPVGMICTITPANLMRLAEISNQYREQLIRDVRDGTLWSDLPIPAELRRNWKSQIATPNPQRARELEQVIAATGNLYPKDFWPLAMLNCWIGGTVGYESKRLPQFYGNIPARDVGLVSTEGRHTIPTEDGTPEGLLAIQSNFYEFIPQAERGSATPVVLEPHELQPGQNYFMLMTTSSGLYRYDIGDLVRCTGFRGQVPLIEFLHKEGNCSDMEGEKVSEHQVVEAVSHAAGKLGIELECFTACPVRPERGVPYYALLIEAQTMPDDEQARHFLKLVDDYLIAHNVMYSGKRSDRYIGDWELLRLSRGSWAQFVEKVMQRRGTGDSQYKHPALVADPQWLNNFQPISRVTAKRAAIHAA